jgi:hypothetical protein
VNLWDPNDRDAFASLLRTVFTDAAVGQVLFHAYSEAHRQVKFELVLMPLIHTSETINRVLGAVTAIDPPFWLGSEPLARCTCIGLTEPPPSPLRRPRSNRPQAPPRLSGPSVGVSASIMAVSIRAGLREPEWLES